MVHGDGLAGELPWAAPGDRRYQGADADAVGGESDDGEGDPGIHHRLDGGVEVEVVPDEEAVPACVLGPAGALDEDSHVAVGAALRDVEAELHIKSSSRRR